MDGSGDRRGVMKQRRSFQRTCVVDSCRLVPVGDTLRLLASDLSGKLTDGRMLMCNKEEKILT